MCLPTMTLNSVESIWLNIFLCSYGESEDIIMMLLITQCLCLISFLYLVVENIYGGIFTAWKKESKTFQLFGIVSRWNEMRKQKWVYSSKRTSTNRIRIRSNIVAILCYVESVFKFSLPMILFVHNLNLSPFLVIA